MMDSDAIFETCLPILKDDSLEEEDKTDKLEEHIRKEANLTGKSLENSVLDVLWRYRNQSTPSTSPTVRHTVVRRNSPAPWQASRSGTPVAGSPRSAAPSPAPQGNSLGVRPALLRMKSSYTSQSPFTSPRPSPRPSYLAPYTSPSPKPSFDYEHGTAHTPSLYDEYDPMTGEWLGSDDGNSVASGGLTGENNDWTQPGMMEMSPYDILRSVLRDQKSDQEIEQILEASGYDLSAAIASLMEGQGNDTSPEVGSGQNRTFLVGKSMVMQRPATPLGEVRSPVMCRYWLSTGQCLRADCRFSHDLSTVVCKYWLAGHCLAGDSCIFSHDPSSLMGNMSLGSDYSASPPQSIVQPEYQLQDYSSFPSLSSGAHGQSPGMESPLRNLYAASSGIAPPPGFTTRSGLAPEFIPSRSQSRPTSSRGPGSSVDESEAFPSLGSAALRAGRKHHGKRGHGHGHKEKEIGPSSLAEVVRNAPNPSPVASPRRSLRRPGSYTGRENSSTAQAIPAPEHIPWLETGDRVNKAYMKARQEAIKHGGARNKFLQSAAQAWNRNDVRAAKALSLRGQSENELMREAHRIAARHLYDDRNQHSHFSSASSSSDHEIFIDLHGLHPAEAVSYLATALSDRRSEAKLQRDDGESSKRGVLYAIVGAGTHSKGGRDKIGKAIRAYLHECRYAWREFGVPVDGSVAVHKSNPGVGGLAANGNPGGIIGVNALSADMSTVKSADSVAVAVAIAAAEEEGEGKVGGGGSEGAIERGIEIGEVGIGEDGEVKMLLGEVRGQSLSGKITLMKKEEVRPPPGLGRVT